MKLLEFFWPDHHFDTDPQERAAKIIFLQATLLATLGRFFITVLGLETSPAVFTMAGFVYVGILVGGLFLFRRQQDVFYPSVLIMGAYFSAGAWTLYNTGGEINPILSGLAYIMILGMVCQGMRLAIIWGIIAVVITAGFPYLALQGWLPATPLTPEQKRAFEFTFSIFNLCMTFLTFYILYRNFSTYRKLLENSRLDSAHLVHVISHDLRSPLQIIQSYTQLLLAGGDPTKIADYGKQIQKSVDRIGAVLNRVRDYEGILTRKLTLTLETVALDQIVTDALENVGPTYQSKNVQVEVIEESPKADLQVCADPLVLSEQVLTNLLSNAFKFSAPGGKIRICMGKKGAQTFLTIRDYGIGIPKETLETSLNVGRATSRVGTQGEKGTGFGLPIVKWFLDQQKIQFQMESWEQPEDQTERGTKVTLLFKSGLTHC